MWSTLCDISMTWHIPITQNLRRHILFVCHLRWSYYYSFEVEYFDSLQYEMVYTDSVKVTCGNYTSPLPFRMFVCTAMKSRKLWLVASLVGKLPFANTWYSTPHSGYERLDDTRCLKRTIQGHRKHFSYMAIRGLHYFPTCATKQTRRHGEVSSNVSIRSRVLQFT